MVLLWLPLEEENSGSCIIIINIMSIWSSDDDEDDFNWLQSILRDREGLRRREVKLETKDEDGGKGEKDGQVFKG